MPVMTGSMATGPPPREGARSLPPFVARPPEAAHVVVPLDGSRFAERALPVATGPDADMHVVEVVPPDAAEDSEGAVRYLHSVARAPW
jgi:hypothetical protein